MSETTANEADRRPWASLAKADEPYSHFEAWEDWLEKKTVDAEITLALSGYQEAMLYDVMCEMADRAEKAERERDAILDWAEEWGTTLRQSEDKSAWIAEGWSGSLRATFQGNSPEAAIRLAAGLES